MASELSLLLALAALVTVRAAVGLHGVLAFVVRRHKAHTRHRYPHAAGSRARHGRPLIIREMLAMILRGLAAEVAAARPVFAITVATLLSASLVAPALAGVAGLAGAGPPIRIAGVDRDLPDHRICVLAPRTTQTTIHTSKPSQTKG